MSINGVEGEIGSHCGPLGCADALPSAPDELPEASEPLVVSVPDGSRIEGAAAHPAGGGQARPLELDGMRLGDVPAGTEMISLSLRWGDGSAVYYWAVDD